MFVGNYPYKVDEKGRIAIPPSFRTDLTNGGFVTPGAEGCLFLYTRAKFEEISRSYEKPGIQTVGDRTIARTFFSRAAEIKLDTQGRIMLAPELRQYAGITDSAVVVGVNTNAEIWSPDKWKVQQQDPSLAWQVLENTKPLKEKPE